MRQIVLLISVLLLGLSWAAAQDASSQASPGSQGYGRTARQDAASQMTVEGCLSGSDGNFTLSDKNGTTYQLTGDTAKLSQHVGHEVKVTGNMNSAASSNAGTSNGSMGNTGSPTMEVTSVKHISKSCKSTGGTPKY